MTAPNSESAAGSLAGSSSPVLPYKIATLCLLRDARGRELLLERAREPNRGLFSPIGGKLEMAQGESPTQCAHREIAEEAGLTIPIDRLELLGIVSETAYEGKAHWLLFVYRVCGAVDLVPQTIDEGQLSWHTPESIDGLASPETDREVIWPLVRRYPRGFFAAHIDCTGPKLRWSVEHALPAAPQASLPHLAQGAVREDRPAPGR